jgi:glycosyltransferase involved in cell wall biosynthesis
VVGGSHAVDEGLQRLRGMPPHLYRLLPYGVPPPTGGAGADELRRTFGLGDDDLLVGMVSATSDPGKGHAVFVDAVGRTPGAHGIIIGAPPPDDVAAAVADPAARVTVVGRLEHLGDAYQAMDALVVPSVSDESMPLVVLEAMACGRPVLASRLSGIPEAVAEGVTGALFTPGSTAELVALLRDSRDSFASWGAAGRETWAERFSVDAMTQSVLSLYAG